jgi:hypothetical protein
MKLNLDEFFEKTRHVKHNVKEAENKRTFYCCFGSQSAHLAPKDPFGPYKFFPSLLCEVPKKFISKPYFLLPES